MWLKEQDNKRKMSKKNFYYWINNAIAVIISLKLSVSGLLQFGCFKVAGGSFISHRLVFFRSCL